MKERNFIPRLIYKKKTYASIKDPIYQKLIISSLAKLFLYVRTLQTFNLKHKNNRSETRTNNKNITVCEISIIQLMKSFLIKKNYINDFLFPIELYFFSKFHREYIGDDLSLSTFRHHFYSLGIPSKDKKIKSFNFTEISKEVSIINPTIQISNIELDADFKTITQYFKISKGRN